MTDDANRRPKLGIVPDAMVRSGEYALRRGASEVDRRCVCGAAVRNLPHLPECPAYVAPAQEIFARPGPRGDYDLIVKHVVRGNPLYVELRNGSRFVGRVVDFTNRIIELDVGLISMADIAFVSSTSIPHIGLVGR